MAAKAQSGPGHGGGRGGGRGLLGGLAQRIAFLPDPLRRFLRRRAFEAAGFLFLVLAGALALAMASYDSLDPSLNSAAGRPTQNLLGGPGALAADIRSEEHTSELQ